MKQTSKRFSSMILAVVFLVAALIIFFDLIQPTYADLLTKKGTEASSEQLLANEQQLVTQIKALLTKYQGETQAQASLALAMPSGPDVSGALAQVYGIAAGTNVSIRTVVVSPPSIQLQSTAAAKAAGGNGTAPTAAQIIKPRGKITLQIAGTGSYEALKNFLQGLETNIRLFDVTIVGLQGVPSSQGAGARGPASTPDLFTFSVAAVTYYQLP